MVIFYVVEMVYVGGYGGLIEQVFKEKIILLFEVKIGSKVVYVFGNFIDLLVKL